VIKTPNCYIRKCVHLSGVFKSISNSEKDERPNCSAFPQGIPDEIAYGANLHLAPLSAQINDIVYEQENR